MKQNPANETVDESVVKDMMWKFLMDGGQKENIPALKEYVYGLIKMTTQKTAEQNKKFQVKGDINWKDLDMTLMSIVIEATCLVLSGRLDGLEDKPG